MFYDKHNTEIRVGDILRYQETDNDAEDYGKSLDEVVMHGGDVCAIQRIGFPRWTELREVIKEPIALRHYAPYGENRITCVEIIGNVREHPERMTPEHAWRVFSANIEVRHARANNPTAPSVDASHE